MAQQTPKHRISPVVRKKVIAEIAKAIRHRVAEWDAYRKIELLLNEDVALSEWVEYSAVTCNTTQERAAAARQIFESEIKHTPAQA
jgi:hypothetical protein